MTNLVVRLRSETVWEVPAEELMREAADYIERLEKALTAIRNDAIESIHDSSMLMSLPPRNPLASRILYQHLVDDRFGVVDEPEPKT